MTATSAPTAAPAWAIQTWVDTRSIYFQLSSPHGPQVLAFPRDGSGFQRALAILFARHEVEGHGEVYHRPSLDFVNRDASPLPNRDGVSADQRREARDILKRMKII